jgi:alanine-alpha-ketoisovalerate/valine-pyruvate aminotransferase
MPAAESINRENLKSLSGTDEDLKNPVYQRLKKHLTVLARTLKQCRFVYLMEHKPDGRIFFFL